jgi:hypothetical protein
VFEIKERGLDIISIKGIRPAYYNFVQALSGDSTSAIAELIEAVTKGELGKEDLEFLLKLAPYSVKDEVFLAAEDLLKTNFLDSEEEEAIARIIMNYSGRM